MNQAGELSPLSRKSPAYWLVICDHSVAINIALMNKFMNTNMRLNQ